MSLYPKPTSTIKKYAQIEPMKPEKLARHNKTGHIYKIIGEAKNCTNGVNDGQAMVVYTNQEMTFVRDKKEFLEKFTLL
jgi:hypothetical protein